MAAFKLTKDSLSEKEISLADLADVNEKIVHGNETCQL